MLNKITKAPPHMRPLLLGCCASGNLGTMLLIVIPGACSEKGNPFGDPTTCNAQALAYATLSMGASDVVFWLYVYNIVRLSLGVEKTMVNAIDSKACAKELNMEEGSASIDMKGSSFIRSEDVDANSQTLPPIGASKETKVQDLKEPTKSFYQKHAAIIKRLFTPSTYGVIVGLLIGGISPIKETLTGENAPLRAIQGAVKMLGDGAIPVTTLMMGGTLVKGFRKSDARVSHIIGVTLIRYLFLPIVGIGVIKGAIHFGILHPDPLHQFVLLVQYALPPTMNMGVISQLFSAGESECSIIFLWTYALTLVLFPLWSAFFMWLIY